MEPVLTPREMGEADRRTIAGGTSEAVLVARAGHAVARAARARLGGTYGRRVVVVCGRGNNGADGRVAAKVLRGWGARVVVHDLDGGVDRAAFARELRRADLLVDAMFGTGFRGELDGDAAHVAEASTRAARVLAVDIPSGVDGLTGARAGPAVRADTTVTFAARKPGLLFEPGRSHAGTLAVADIGIDAGRPFTPDGPPTAVLDEPDVAAWVPRRAPADHKWSSGLLVVAGAAGMTGAAALVGRAALRAGAGMVVCGLPGAAAAAHVAGTELVTRALPEDGGGLAPDAAEAILDGLERFRAVVIGPGLGRSPGAAHVVTRVVAEAPIPVVVDADGLHALAGTAGREAGAARAAAGSPPVVLTPHAGEYRALRPAPPAGGPDPLADRLAAARDLAAESASIVLLKGPGTVVADGGGRAVVVDVGGTELATAGTGDVLAGAIGALLARGAAPFAAAAAGAWVHGRTAATIGPGLVAGDLASALGRTLASLQLEPGDARHA